MSFTERSFELLRDLRENNHKSWYDEHRAEIKVRLRDPFAEVLEQASRRLRRNKYPLRGSAQTMFRMHRDIRFSNDKSPYKTNVSGLMTESGDKHDDGAILYAHLDADGGFIATGFHSLPTKQLNQIRNAILSDASVFARLTRKLERSEYDFMQDDKLKSMPRGYSQHSQHPLVDYLKLKHVVLQQTQLKSVWIDGTIVDRIVQLNKASADLLIFGVEALASGGVDQRSQKKGV